MTIKQKIYAISFLILVIYLIVAAVIYYQTGQVVIAIFVAPPIIHWMLQHRNQQQDK